MFFNNINPYQQRLQQMEQNFGQPIQTIQPQQPQAVCYFVSSKSDLQNIQVQPNIVYIGINKQDNEIYMRAWNNDGIIDFDTYSRSGGEKENTELKSIMDKLDLILKEKGYGRNDTANNSEGDARTVSEQPNDGIV